MAYDDVVAKVTLSGSLISCIATCCVLVSYMIFRDELRSFRQALVFNLALAEFLNTLNNTISGFIYVQSEALNPGPACVANGFINQLTVQAVDFTIIAIVSVTLLTITQKTYLPSVSFRAKTLICLSTWVMPVITSTVAVGMGAMSPVSGNWCWITAERTDLRYALTHGWRIAIIFLTVLLYAYIWWYVHCHFKALFGSGRGGSGSYNPFTGSITLVGDGRKNRRTESIVLNEERQPYGVVAGSMGTLTPAGLQSGGRLIGQNSTSKHGPLSTSSEVLIQGKPPRPDTPYRDVNDSPMHGWPPLQQPAQTTTVSNNGLHPARSVTPERQPEWYAEGAQGIVRSFDVHVSFAEQPLPRAMMPHHPVAVRTGQQAAIGTCSTADWSSATINLVETHDDAPKSLPQTHAPNPPPGQHVGRGFEREVRRMLLLNAYPRLYVLLWIPGIVNRLMEATGTSPSNTRIVGALQSTSQFVGFANALTFGLSATMRRRIASAAPRGNWLGRRRGKRRESLP